MIVAYLLLAHAHPRQLARLAAALPADSPLFVHIDARAPTDVFTQVRARLAARPHTAFVQRHACRWGGIGIVRGTVSLIDALVHSDIHFDYATLLSGTDYPIKSNAGIADFLARNRGTEFIESFRMDLPNRWSNDGGIYRAPDKLLRYHLRIRSWVRPTPLVRKLPYGLLPYGGTQWWTLTREAIRFISTYLRTHPAVMRFMNGVFIPDESLIQTVLGASPMAGAISGDPLRMAIWDRPQPPYPAVLTSADMEAMATSPALFARKFSDAVDAKVYALIDRTLRQQR